MFHISVINVFGKFNKFEDYLYYTVPIDQPTEIVKKLTEDNFDFSTHGLKNTIYWEKIWEKKDETISLDFLFKLGDHVYHQRSPQYPDKLKIIRKILKEKHECLKIYANVETVIGKTKDIVIKLLIITGYYINHVPDILNPNGYILKIIIPINQDTQNYTRIMNEIFAIIPNNITSKPDIVIDNDVMIDVVSSLI